MSSFNLIYNSLIPKYKGTKLFDIFADFNSKYQFEYNNNDEYGLQNWLDLYTPVYKKYYWDRINSYKRRALTYKRCEIFRMWADPNEYILIKYLD